MALRRLLCLLSVLAATSALGNEREFPRRHFPHGRGPARTPLRRFIRKSTHDSLDLDLLITPGLDPCHMNDTEIVVENKVVGELKDSMVFGLRGFDQFRQQFNIRKRLVQTTLTFELLEGSGKAAIQDGDKAQKQFKLNVIAEMVLVIRSKLQFNDHHVQLSDSFLRRSIEPTVRLFPSKPVRRRLLNKIGKSFIIQAEQCARQKFVPAFESGVNRALLAKNITAIIQEIRKDASILHKFFDNATKAVSKKVVKQMLNLQLPNVELEDKRNGNFNMTEGRVLRISKPKLYFYNPDEQKDVYNLQLVIKKLNIGYKIDERSLPCNFANVQLLLQIKQESKTKLEVLKGVVIGVEIPRPPRPSLLQVQITSKLYALLMNFLEPQLKSAFTKFL